MSQSKPFSFRRGQVSAQLPVAACEQAPTIHEPCIGSRRRRKREPQSLPDGPWRRGRQAVEQLAAELQQTLFERAVVLGHEGERDESLREQLAKFLHDHHARTLPR
jgi:hypothetical protein